MRARIGLYARVAAPDQPGARSIEQQVEQLRAYARARGWTVPAERVYRDEGVNGLRPDRPGLDHLRAAVARAEVDLLLVVSPDRLARDQGLLAQLLGECERAGCRVMFTDPR